MNNKFDQLVRREQTKARLIKLCALVTILFLFTAITYTYVMTALKGSVIIVGVVKSKHTQLREDGHRTYLFVEVPNDGNLAKVRLPKNLPIKLNVKVELLEQQARFSEGQNYKFLRYVEK